MQRSIDAAATALLLGSLLAHPARAEDKRAEAEILKIEKIMAAATTADAAMTAHDPNFLLYDLMPPNMRGYDTVKKHFTQLFANIKNASIEIVTMAIVADSQLGFANSTQRLTIKDDKGATTLNAVLRVTDCYHKVGGKWLLLSQHNSFPVDLATGKAVFAAQ